MVTSHYSFDFLLTISMIDRQKFFLKLFPPLSMSLPSSSSSSREWVNDVFLSFSGVDIRTNFLSHFLKELDRKLIIVFKDNEIERGQSLGPKLKRAIKDSRIAVVIFSRNYASSSWCLNELLEIVRCKKDFNQLVIPIFYRLDPTHVRKQSGVFGINFQKTCCNKSEKVKIRWRKALTYVANILGYHSSLTCQNEAKLIDEIINNVLSEIILTPSKDSEEYVDIETHIANMIVLLHLEAEEVRMVGIWGIVGIGKTTIARILFNRLSCRFRCSVFIDRAFMSKSMELYSSANPDDYNMKLHLQGIFLSEILGEKDIKVRHLGVVKERLKNHKVLIFIDDLENQVVLDALVGHTQWFGCGSRIIVITEHKHLLKAHGIDLIYEVHLPSHPLALQILCRSAFRQTYPPDGFMELSSESVLRAGKLPLVLNVMGSHLRGKDKEDWMDLLLMFQKGESDKIEKTLKFSYNGLHTKKVEAIFHHIACFFNGEDVNDIKSLLTDSDLDVNTAIKNLVDKSLSQETCNTVEMHSLVQEMGKEIVRAQSNEPGKREFLVDPKDICDVLEHNTGAEDVLGISLDIDETDEVHIHESAFKKMRNLRFLKFYSQENKDVIWHLPADFDYLPPKLRLLSWEKYPLRSLPSKFLPGNLVKLDMRFSKLEKLWEGIHSVANLKKIDLWGSKNLIEIPDLSNATNLMELNLSYCSSLVELPSSIQYLSKLEELWMEGCKSLEILPTGINLQSLYSLDLIGCSRLRTFPDISSNISKLYLCGTSIEEFPSNLRLENLDDFCMHEMRSEKLGERIQHFMKMLSPTLMDLYLSDIPSLVELPSSFQNLHTLHSLRITNCINLETLPPCINLESLILLDLSGCSRLTSFPDIAINIERLNLSETGIEEVPWWIEKFSKLTYLTMCGCKRLQWVSLNICKLKDLFGADFSDCRALYRIRWDDCQSSMEMAADNIHSNKFRFTNCFNLDREALLQQPILKRLVLPGEEVPSYFTHRTTEISLTNVPLLHTSLSQQFFKFKACVAVIPDSDVYNGVNIYVNCQFKGRHGESFDSYGQAESFWTKKDSYLLIFECRIPLDKDNAPLDQHNYDHVDMQIHISKNEDSEDSEDNEDSHEYHNRNDSSFTFKGWGIRLFKDCSSPQNQFGNPNTLPPICETYDDSNETEHCEECGGNDVVTAKQFEPLMLFLEMLSPTLRSYISRISQVWWSFLLHFRISTNLRHCGL